MKIPILIDIERCLRKIFRKKKHSVKEITKYQNNEIYLDNNRIFNSLLLKNIKLQIGGTENKIYLNEFSGSGAIIIGTH